MTIDRGWKKTIDDGFEDPARSAWDGMVLIEVSDYNARLATTPAYVSVDWKLVLAMLWVESGGPKMPAWFGRVMQIGNATDKGYPALKKHEGATELVVREALLNKIDKADRKDLNDPTFNIQVGTAYLFERMATSAEASLPDLEDTGLHEQKISRDAPTASALAKREGTTLADLEASNPGVNINRMHEGQVLHFHKAHMGRRITGWFVFDEATVARRYNGHGDPAYTQKLRYVMQNLTHWSGGGRGGGAW